MRKSNLQAVNWRLGVILVALLIMGAFFHVKSGGLFFSPENIYNIVQQTAVVGIISTVAVMIIASRNIDLSVGSAMGFIGVLIAWMQYTHNLPWPVTVFLGLAAAILIGLYHGFLTAYIGVPSFIVTLGGLLSLRGAAFLVSDGKTQPVNDPSFLALGGGLNGSIGVLPSYCLAVLLAAWMLYRLRVRHQKRMQYGNEPKPLALDVGITILLVAALFIFVGFMCSYTISGKNEAQGVPIPVLIWGTMAWFISFIARRTRFGRYVFAIGGNPEAAELVGIPVKRIILILFVLTSVLVTVAACVAVARLNAGTNSLGTNLELFVIASAVIGGTALAGGSGSITGSIIGALMMQCLDSGMLLLDVSIGERMVVIGQLLIVAVIFDVLYRRHFGEQ